MSDFHDSSLPRAALRPDGATSPPERRPQSSWIVVVLDLEQARAGIPNEFQLFRKHRLHG
jgi:hypothetical protein